MCRTQDYFGKFIRNCFGLSHKKGWAPHMGCLMWELGALLLIFELSIISWVLFVHQSFFMKWQTHKKKKKKQIHTQKLFNLQCIIVTSLTCGIARLAIVRPAMTSDFRRETLYSEPHWNIGKKNWRQMINFLNHVWFLHL